MQQVVFSPTFLFFFPPFFSEILSKWNFAGLWFARVTHLSKAGLVHYSLKNPTSIRTPLASRTTSQTVHTDRHSESPLRFVSILFCLFAQIIGDVCQKRNASRSFWFPYPSRWEVPEEDGRQQVFLFFISKLLDRWWINNPMNKKKTVMSQWRGASRKPFDFFFCCCLRVEFVDLESTFLASRFVFFCFVFVFLNL